MRRYDLVVNRLVVYLVAAFTCLATASGESKWKINSNDFLGAINLTESTSAIDSRGREAATSRMRGTDGLGGIMVYNFWSHRAGIGICKSGIDLQFALSAREEIEIVDVTPIAAERALLKCHLSEKISIQIGRDLSEKGIYGNNSLRPPILIFAKAPSARYDEALNARSQSGIKLSWSLSSAHTLDFFFGRFDLDQIDTRTFEATTARGTGGAFEWRYESPGSTVIKIDAEWYDHSKDSLNNGPFGTGETIEIGASFEYIFGKDVTFRVEGAYHKEKVGTFVAAGKFTTVPVWAELDVPLLPGLDLGIRLEHNTISRSSFQLAGKPRVSYKLLEVGARWYPGRQRIHGFKVSGSLLDFDTVLGVRPVDGGLFQIDTENIDEPRVTAKVGYFFHLPKIGRWKSSGGTAAASRRPATYK